ncbi:MAG: hypothetical protein ACREV6_19650 [Clostridium sp.]|uniref:hypothetical protein n=1 Tax=Clostridium sp. TaxID=1506 RepID=UPI003D6CE4FD
MQNKSLEDIKELIKTLSIVTDYAMCMKVATRYSPSSAPNLLNIMRIINRIKKEYEI